MHADRSLRQLLGANSQEEYIKALADAKGHIDDALRTMDPAIARRAIMEAGQKLHVADTRLSSHAAPPV